MGKSKHPAIWQSGQWLNKELGYKNEMESHLSIWRSGDPVNG